MEIIVVKKYVFSFFEVVDSNLYIIVIGYFNKSIYEVWRY